MFLSLLGPCVFLQGKWAKWKWVRLDEGAATAYRANDSSPSCGSIIDRKSDDIVDEEGGIEELSSELLQPGGDGEDSGFREP